MRIERANGDTAKGWYVGPWNSTLGVSIGYANEGINEPHLHTRITEIYMVARGTSVMQVEHETINLAAGDMIIVEPGEVHTFLSSSPDYFHFVLHTPGLAGEEARAEKRVLPASPTLAAAKEL
jgi:mannose-6-phosphate isomerase-like protein (cupin superfamily)